MILLEEFTRRLRRVHAITLALTLGSLALSTEAWGKSSPRNAGASPEPPTQAPAPHDILKNRYISIDRRNPGLNVFDIKLTLSGTQVSSVPVGMIGSQWWAHCPDEECISIVGPNRPATPPDWSACTTVHLTGCPILPTTTYDIVVLDGVTESAPAYEGQTQLRPGAKWWGDSVGMFNGSEWSPPQGVANFDDVNAAIKTFQKPEEVGPVCNNPPCNAVHVSRSDVEPAFPTSGPGFGVPNKVTNFADVGLIILGFQGSEYAGGDIGRCLPVDSSCAGPCDGAADDTPCEDGDVCTVEDTCQGGVCTSGTDVCMNADKEPGTKSNEFTVPFPFEMQAPTGASGLLDPVNLFSGEFYESTVDLRIAGRGFDLVWGRKYRSKIGPNTEMGNGWDFSYNVFLEQAGPHLFVHGGTGRTDAYLLQPDGTWTRPQFFRVIAQNHDDSFTMTFPHKGEWNFHPFDGSPEQGKIDSIVDRNGNTMTFEYDAAGRLTTVRDTLHTATNNRELTIAYNVDGFIQSVTDFAGRSVSYEFYDGVEPGGDFGDLKSVTSPPVVDTANFPIPAGHEYLNGKRVEYTYSTGFADDRLNHNLLTITDAKGQTYLINEYDPTTNDSDLNFDRVNRQTWGDTGDIIDLVYVPQVPDSSNNQAVIKTIVNDRVGNVKELFYDATNCGVAEREYTGRADPDLPTTDTNNRPTNPLRTGDPPFFETTYEFNPDGLPVRSVAPNGNEMVMTYDETDPDRRSQGNLLERCRLPGALGGDQSQICESYEYDDGSGGCCGTNFVTRYVDGRGNETLHTYDSRGNREHTQHRIPSIVEDWEYNGFGQMTAHIHPDNGSTGGHRRRDEFTYYTTGPQEGYLKDTIVDAPNLALATTREYNLVGIVTRLTDARGHDTQYVVNQLNQTVRERSREVNTAGLRYEQDTFYDPNNNVVRVDIQNVDDQDVLQPNSHFTIINEYDVLNYLTRTCAEVGDYSGPIPGTPQVPICTGLPANLFLTNEYEYDANRNRTLERSGEAVEGRQPTNVVETLYDERDLLFRETRAPGDTDQSTTQYDYDGNRNVSARIQGLEDAPRVIQNAYDGYDRLVRVEDPMGNEITFEYDANHNQVGMRSDGELVDGPGGASNVRLGETTFTYDDMDRVTRKEIAFFDTDTQAPILVGPTPDGVSSTDFQWNDNSQVVLVTDDNLHQTTFEYDDANRLVRVVDHSGNSTDYAYDANSNVVAVTETDKSDLASPDQVFTTTYQYDNLDRLILTVDNVGNLSTQDYDSRDNRTFEDDALGRDTRYTYDGYDRLIETVHDLDGDGADGDGADVTTSQTWDDASRLVGRTDDNGSALEYEYDALNRRIAIDFPDCTQHVFTYDVHDNQLVMTDDGNGSLSICSYDALDRLVNSDITPGPGVSSDTTFESYQYDGLSRLVVVQDDDSLVTRSHNSLSRVTRETLNGQATTCLFDGVGNKVQVTYPGGRSISTGYDVLDRKKFINDTTGVPQMIAAYDFVGPDRVERRTYGNNTQTDYAYDGITGIPNPPNDFGVKQVVATSHVNLASGAVIDQRIYTWDPMDNKTRREDVRPGPRFSHTYMYDDLDRLVQSVATDENPPPAAVRTTTYDYDGVGNRLQVLGGLGAGTYFMDANVCDPADAQMNQYSITPFDQRQYDPNGNLSAIDPGQRTERIIVYDYRDQMVEYIVPGSGVAHSYSYDALGRRIARVEDSPAGGPMETRYFYDGWQVVEEQDPTGGTQATYVYGLYIDEVLSMQRFSTDFFYHTDDMFNVMAVTDPTGNVVERYEYDDYGTPLDPNSLSPQPGQPSTVGNPYRFSGRRYDHETGWYYYRSRYLDPGAGRFLSRDMIGIWGDAHNVGNAYAYAGGNPFSYVDPYGRAKEKFVRNKPHVNIGTIGHVDHGKTNSLATFNGDRGVVIPDGSLRMNKADLVETLASKKLFVGGLSWDTTDEGSSASSSDKRKQSLYFPEQMLHGKKSREIVVVGSKVKDVVRSASANCTYPLCGGLHLTAGGAEAEEQTAGGIIIPDTSKGGTSAHGHLDYLKKVGDPATMHTGMGFAHSPPGPTPQTREHILLARQVSIPHATPMPQTREHVLLARQVGVARSHYRRIGDITLKRGLFPKKIPGLQKKRGHSTFSAARSPNRSR